MSSLGDRLAAARRAARRRARRGRPRRRPRVDPDDDLARPSRAAWRRPRPTDRLPQRAPRPRRMPAPVLGKRRADVRPAVPAPHRSAARRHRGRTQVRSVLRRAATPLPLRRAPATGSRSSRRTVHAELLKQLGPHLTPPTWTSRSWTSGCAPSWPRSWPRRTGRSATATGPGSPRRSATTSWATARSSPSCATRTSPRSWSTGTTASGWRRRAGWRMPTRSSATRRHLRRTIDKIVSRIGRRVDESSPMVDARLPDGSRVNAVIPPLAVDGSALTIRKFSADPLTAQNLIEFGSLSPQTADFLDACVRGRLNIIVSGSTGAGKTTTLNVLSSFIPTTSGSSPSRTPPSSSSSRSTSCASSRARPTSRARARSTIRDLVKNSLRMRPDRIIVGEVRDASALDMLQAMNTGHDGSICTLHSNGPRDTLARMETMVLMAGHGPADARHPRAGRLRGRPDRPPDPLQGRLAPDHPHHRGGADGGRRDHPPGHLRLRPLGRLRPRRQGPGAAAVDRPAAEVPREDGLRQRHRSTRCSSRRTGSDVRRGPRSARGAARAHPRCLTVSSPAHGGRGRVDRPRRGDRGRRPDPGLRPTRVRGRPRRRDGDHRRRGRPGRGRARDLDDRRPADRGARDRHQQLHDRRAVRGSQGRRAHVPRHRPGRRLRRHRHLRQRRRGRPRADPGPRRGPGRDRGPRAQHPRPTSTTACWRRSTWRAPRASARCWCSRTAPTPATPSWTTSPTT